MPFYVFKCKAGHEKKKLLSLEDAELTPSIKCAKLTCYEPMVLTIGAPSALGKESADEYRGKSRSQDLKQQLADRQHEHFVKHELPRIIQTQGKEFAIRQGFIDEEGKPLRKLLK